MPLVVALGVAREPRWSPIGDLAQIELRVRDVGFAHPPLLGLPGRLRAFGTVGSHPGPLSFYALAPVYRLLGADGWALQVASAMLSLGAAWLAIWIGYRRGGWRFALATAATLVMLLRSYGAWRLVDAWNPNLPVVWWFVFLLAVWSVLCDDFPLLPVAVFAGSYCSQTHVPYLALVAGLGTLTVLGLGVRWLTLREVPALRRRLLRWVGLGAGLAGLLWLPPLIEQMSRDPGNLAIIVETFRHPSQPQVSFGDALDEWIRRLDIGELLTTDRSQAGWHPVGSPRAGLVSLGAWVASAVVAARRPNPSTSAQLRLHVLIGAALVVELVTMSRIVGTPWPYLMLWAWGTTALLALAIAWTLVAGRTGADRSDPTPTALSVSEPLRPTPTMALVGLAIIVLAIGFAVDAAHTRAPAQDLWRPLAAVAQDTLPALEDDPANCGDECRYLVTWTDPWQGFGLIAALEREGYDTRAGPAAEFAVRTHRVIDPEKADAVIHIATGADAIEEARARRGTDELALAVDRDGSARPVAVFLTVPRSGSAASGR